MDGADIQTVEVTSFNQETVEMEHKAKEVAQILTTSYPNYPWAVGWHDGAVIAVKLMINPDSNWGFTIDGSKACTAKQLVHAAKMAGGEMLERLGLKRGAWDGDLVQQNCEGVPLEKRTPIFYGPKA